MAGQPPARTPLLYSVKGAYQALGMSRAKFYKKAKAGFFHILKDDGNSVIDAAEVKSYAAMVKSGKFNSGVGSGVAANGQ